MAERIQVGIDIGTHQVKVAVTSAPQDRERSKPQILGVGFAESKGMRHGYIVSGPETRDAIRRAIDQAEKASGVKIKKAYVGLGGIGLGAIVSNGSVVITRVDQEITDFDVNQVMRASEEAIPKSAITNRKIIHAIPIQYKVDGKPVLGRPHGMKGTRLEVKTLFITYLEHHLNDILQTVDDAGIDVEDVAAAPLASSLVTLTKLQKMYGCVLANIGAETVSIVVHENNLPISLETFPIGSTDITNDIALGLRIPIEEAEDIKIGNASDEAYSRRKLEEIVSARLSDIFELIEAHLKKINRNGLLPAGIILTGGGSGLTDMADFAKLSLKLPSKVATFAVAGNLKTPIKDATWAVAYGLCVLGWNSQDEDVSPIGVRGGYGAGRTKDRIKPTRSRNKFPDSVKKAFSWFTQFLP
jgi:cell division protein FtsA